MPTKKITIKWPNDIYFGEKKIAGILIQNIIKGQDVHWSVIGIGLNLAQTVFEINNLATSLALESEVIFDRLSILQELHDELILLFNQSKKDSQFDYSMNYNNSLFQKDETIILEKTNGEILQGKLKSVNESGNLLVEISGEIMIFNWSNVRIRGKQSNESLK